MTWDFSNARITGSSIGPNARTYNGTVSPAELHRHLDDLRSTPLSADESDRHAQLVGMINDLDDAAASGQEDPAALAGRWDRIRAALGPALQTTANVAQISSLIVQLAQG